LALAGHARVSSNTRNYQAQVEAALNQKNLHATMCQCPNDTSAKRNAVFPTLYHMREQAEFTIGSRIDVEN
jgi:hypothetical protein